MWNTLSHENQNTNKLEKSFMNLQMHLGALKIKLTILISEILFIFLIIL